MLVAIHIPVMCELQKFHFTAIPSSILIMNKDSNIADLSQPIISCFDVCLQFFILKLVFKFVISAFTVGRAARTADI